MGRRRCVSAPFLLFCVCLTFTSAGNRVEWFRAKLNLQQWREESEILNEELKRTANWSDKMLSLWGILGDQLLKCGFS